MKKRLFTTTRILMLGFLLGALIGACLLYLPISVKSEVDLKFVDALFVSTSGICVTGLSTVNIGQTFSVFGQVILLLLIQLGGLGFVTFSTLLLIAFHKRVTLEDRLLIQSAYNLDTLSGLLGITIRVVKATLVVELIGALGYALVFIPEFGPIGIWYAIFHSVSAFCNAGIDLLGGNSLCVYRDNVVINVVTMFLIIAGGLGFPVYWEIVRVICKKKVDKRKLNFHAKLVIYVTIALILGGAMFTLLVEYNNPETLGPLSLPNKIMASVFQSVTLRTAGFVTIDQAGFKSASCLLYLIFMFIGGSPAGTAGGVKTITVLMVVVSVIANIKGKKDVAIMNRKITDTIIRRCVAIVSFSFMILVGLSIALLLVCPADFLDVLYEMTSAIATVGLTRGLTSELNTAGKLVVSLAMYLGRIGPISLALAFNSKKVANAVSYAEGKVIIG
ncbi:MAG: potassium transporter TrkG [Eubacteriales bacterium]|nr:potassium transporter TrkG [Eubacteriales bacterium]